MSDHQAGHTLPSPEHLHRLGWTERWSDWFVGLCAESTHQLTPGRIIRIERGGPTVALPSGERLAFCGGPVAVGDWVAVRWQGPDPVVEGVATRMSQLKRLNAEGVEQILAANIDRVFVTAPADRLSISRVEREITAAWGSGAVPTVLVTKGDLVTEDLIVELTARCFGVDLILTSSITGDGIDAVAELLRPNRTAVLLGPSGAGKSSLVNALLQREGQTWRAATGQVRAGDRRGRHTTTNRSIITLESGGVIIDTPGLRALSLAGDEGLAEAFGDIEDLAAGCRFGDCRHDTEPGCAVQAAVSGGLLSPARLASYQKLVRELDYLSRRDDPLARREAERFWKILAKASRQQQRQRHLR